MTTTPARNRPAVGPRPGLVQRLKIEEPVRLYAYGILSALIAGMVLVGWLAGQWGHALEGILGAVLAVVPAAEASRASVYSPATFIRDQIAVQAALARDGGRYRINVPPTMDPVDVAQQIRAAGL